MSIPTITRSVLISAVLLVFIPSLSLAGLDDFLGQKEPDEEERAQTIERMEKIQEKLKLLQDKLRALERRKAAKEAVKQTEQTGDSFAETPLNINWQPIDATDANPGEYGVYTYLLFSGTHEDTQALGLLEDFILTLETLPTNEIPASLGNRFLIPVEKPQSVINLGRQPFDFKLNKAFLDRLGLNDNLPAGPILVSSSQPIDPYGSGKIMKNLVIVLGKQPADRTAKLARVWHAYEKDAMTGTNPLSKLFWEIIEGLGTVQVKREDQNILAILNQNE